MPFHRWLLNTRGGSELELVPGWDRQSYAGLRLPRAGGNFGRFEELKDKER